MPCTIMESEKNCLSIVRDTYLSLYVRPLRNQELTLTFFDFIALVALKCRKI